MTHSQYFLCPASAHVSAFLQPDPGGLLQRDRDHHGRGRGQPHPDRDLRHLRGRGRQRRRRRLRLRCSGEEGHQSRTGQLLREVNGGTA